jgi:sarcosine oxidase gamma subunit
MDKEPEAHIAIDIQGLPVGVQGLSVGVEQEFAVASLRYFDAAGVFAGAVREAIGRPLPQPLRAVSEPVAAEAEGAPAGAQLVLAWRTPTETLLVCSDRRVISGLERRLAGAADGCIVNQTGGIWAIRVQGPRARELLLRLGSAASIPALGEARSSRLADLHVTAICVREGEILLLLERVYAAHLLAWIHATAADFE